MRTGEIQPHEWRHQGYDQLVNELGVDPYSAVAVPAAKWPPSVPPSEEYLAHLRTLQGEVVVPDLVDELQKAEVPTATTSAPATRIDPAQLARDVTRSCNPHTMADRLPTIDGQDVWSDAVSASSNPQI